MFNCHLDLLWEDTIHFGSEEADLGKETCHLKTGVGNHAVFRASTPNAPSCNPAFLGSPFLKKKGGAPSIWRGQLIWSLKVYCKRNLAVCFKNIYSTFPKSWQRNEKLSAEVSTQKNRGASCCVTGVGWEPTLVSLKNFCEVTFHEHKSYRGHLPSFWLPNTLIPLF